MKRLIFIFLNTVLFILGAVLVTADEDLNLLLPKAEDIRPWELKGEAFVYNEENLYDFINGGAEIFLEYGFSQVISQEYQLKDSTIIINIYQMKDDESAFGIFSNNRAVRFKNMELGNAGFYTDYSINFWQAEYYVIVESFQTGPSISEAMLNCAGLISKKINRKAEALVALKLIPNKNLIPGSQRLVKGILGINNTYYFSEKNIFQIRDKGIGLFADYQINGQILKLFLIKYKSPSDAHLAFVRLQEFFNRSPDYQILQSEQDILLWEKGKNYFSVINKDSILGLALETKDKESALNLLKSLK